MIWKHVRGPGWYEDSRHALLAFAGYLIVPVYIGDVLVRWHVYTPDRDGTPIFLRACESLEYAKRVAREHRAKATKRRAP